MNVDQILQSMNDHEVRYLLIGGMNFMLRHQPLLTFDVDLWIEDTAPNRQRCHQALVGLQAEWGPTEDSWAGVDHLPSDWLQQQMVYCLHSPHGAIDIMRAVEGMGNWEEAWSRGVDEQTANGTVYRGISDQDMLDCQLALGEKERKIERTEYLKKVLRTDSFK